MKLFFVDCYRNCLKVYELDVNKGKYNRAWHIGTENQSFKDSTIHLITLIVGEQPNQVIIDTNGLGAVIKEHFDTLLAKVDFIKKDEQNNIKYVQYMSAEEMIMFIKRVSSEGEQYETNQSN
ncbi:hypothetical protein PQE70_gp239 [Bacillus phage vB_BanS_Nate]|uniref:Uncharacterized protein n=1 Tax=Bacillus phage vB_BanS_Nate TaxID=2894788 RepID=A0AAE9CE81_9CAUD|nr:hypothetical protein PQE70_gp239 [Bacillus phage vB_BanS_Nate]UGO51119.1 hypothetical protein NATE_285 [Bacillus phage vB_BanS_Nate]